MSPDDPRHGTYAGYMAHRKCAERACIPCSDAHFRRTKRMKLRLESGVRNRIPIGHEALNITQTSSIVDLAKRTGLDPNNLRVISRGTPAKIVLRSTRDKILAADAHTPVGIQRRLRALSAIGYSMAHIAPLVGCHPEPLVRMMRRSRPPEVVKSHIARGVVDIYQQLHMTPAHIDRYSKRRRSEAVARNWPTPLGWGDIDNDLAPVGAWRGTLAQRQGPARASVDHARVERIVVHRDFTLAGEATQGERAAVVARWPGTLNDLERLTGWRVERYISRDGAA